MSQSPGPETRVIPPQPAPQDGTEVLSAADRTQAMPAADRTQAVPAADRTQAMPAADRTQVVPAAEPTQAVPAEQPTQAFPVGQPTQAMPAADRTQAMPATWSTPPPARPDRVSALPPVQPAPQAQAPAPAPAAAYRPEPAPSAPARPEPRPAPQQPARPPHRGGTSVTAVFALLAALVGLVVPLVSILAIVLGGIALDRIRRHGMGGRGMAKTGVVLGTIELIFTAVVVIGGLLLWNTYGDDIQQGLDQIDELSQTDLSVPDLLMGGLTGDLSLDDLSELGSAVGDADQLKELGGQCQSGDQGACDNLLERVPDGLLPDDVRQYLPQN